MPLLWGFPRSITRYCGPLTRAMLCSCALLFCSSYAHAELFHGVTPGDSCLDVYHMEISKGATADLPLETMIESELLAFRRHNDDFNESISYQCEEGNISLILKYVEFTSQEAQSSYFDNQRALIETRFGDPSFDAFNPGLMTRFVLRLDGKAPVHTKLPVVQWEQEGGGKVMLQKMPESSNDATFSVIVSWKGH